MARRVRQWEPTHREPTTGAAANEAISDWTAAHSTNMRIKGLKKASKKAEQKLTLASTVATGHAKSTTRFGESLTGAATGVSRQNTQAENLTKRYEAARERLITKMNKDPVSYLKPGQRDKWATASKAERAAMWQNVVTRESERLPQYAAYKGAHSQATAAGQAYKSQTGQYNRLAARAKQSNKRVQMLQRRYMQAYKKYRSATQYVPYRPA